MIIVQLILYCLVFTAMVRISVIGGAKNALYFYPKAVQDAAIERGLVTRDEINRKRKAFMTAFYIVMFTSLILIITAWNKIFDFRNAYLQALLFLEVIKLIFILIRTSP